MCNLPSIHQFIVRSLQVLFRLLRRLRAGGDRGFRQWQSSMNYTMYGKMASRASSILDEGQFTVACNVILGIAVKEHRRHCKTIEFISK